MENTEQIKISGAVEHIVYRNEDTGFTVMEIDCEGELVTAVGEITGIEEGEEVDLTGNYVVHSSFGRQFKVILTERRLPSTAHAMLKYLSSGTIKGIGPVLARRLVEEFGADTLEIAEKDPKQLTRVRGVSPAKAEAINAELKRVFGIRAVMMFLSAYKISPVHSVRIWKKLGTASADIIRENPYVICDEDIGIDFEKADEIASELGIDSDSPYRIKAGIAHALFYNSKNGHTCLPYDKVIDISTEFLGATRLDVELCVNSMIETNILSYCNINRKEYLYLSQFYTAERYCAMRTTLLSNLADNDTDPDKWIDELEKKDKIKYETLQREAIKMAMKKGILILTGGPGTGKTTTLNAIISLYKKQGLRVEIAAPTGRAAKRIAELTGYEAKTIHRLLEVDYRDNDRSKFVHNEKNPLNCDVVIVDEFSMVDILLFESLLRAMPLGCRLIIVGDSNQLPSVGAGNVLGDLLACDRLPTVTLNQIFRQAAESLIVTNAHCIVAGEMPELKVRSKDFFFMPEALSQKAADTLISLVSKRLPNKYGFSPKWDIQVLCPSKLGELGTHNLNVCLQQVLNPPSPQKSEHSFGGIIFRQGDKVMQIKNNYDIEWTKDDGEKGAGVYNGDIGEIIALDKRLATMKIRFDDKVAEYSFDQLNEIEAAYAVTVHKSQGSEFDAVILPLMGKHAKLHYRNLLYTAVTRAKKILIILGEEATVAQMVENKRKTDRYTNLNKFVDEEFERMRSNL